MKTLSTRALNRALLARQSLLEPSALSALELIEHLGGLQSQAANSAYFALSARLKNFAPDDLSTLITSRKVVRLALMRSTVHLASAKDALWLRPTLQPMIERQFASSIWGKANRGVDLETVTKFGRALIEKEPKTPEELAAVLGQKWPKHEGKALAQVIRAFVPLVQLPPRGLWGQPGQPRGTSIEKWLGKQLGRASTETLVIRYLRAFGPASVKDAQTWSGLKGLSEIFERLELEQFKSETGEPLFDLPDAPRPHEDTAAPVRLLGDFEQPLLSYVDRSRILRAEDKARVFSVNGLVRSPVLVDGFVEGLWRLEKNRVVVEMFRGREPDLETEHDRLQSFMRGANSSVM